MFPHKQLATAFYETYGLSEDFSKARFRRVNVGGFRFAVRSFIPRIAYALTLLHRSRMPADSTSPDLQKLADEVARVAAENNWDQYRKKAGIGTYSLAGFIYILPKIGPLKMVAIKGPTAATEEEYVRSVNLSTDALSSALGRFGKPHQTLANRDLDTGAPVRPGAIALPMTPMPSCLHRLVADPHHTVPPGLKADILNYYADPNAPIHTKKNAGKVGPGSVWAADSADHAGKQPTDRDRNRVSLGLHVEEAALQRDHDCVGTIGGAEFREDALEVAFDGVLRDAKLFGDELVRTATGDPTKRFQLPAGERIVSNMLGHLDGDFLGDAAMACVHQPDGIDQLGPQHALQKIAGGSRLERPQSLYVSSIGGQDDDASSGPLLANRCDRVDSVGLGHAQIHERDVWPVHAKQRDRLFAIGCLGHHGHIRLRHNRARNAAPQERMIVHRKHSDWLLVTHDCHLSTAVTLLPERQRRALQSAVATALRRHGQFSQAA